MKSFVITILLAFFAVPVSSHALNVYGVQVDGSAVIEGQTLHLNGFGLRSKMFGKVYIGSLYLTRQITKSVEVINDPGVKLVRINFLHNRILKDKFVEAINEAFIKNVSGFAGSSDAQRFYALFTKDFVKGDVLDISFVADGSVRVSCNNQIAGTIVSKKLQNAILKAFIGLSPIDESVKIGMLGKL